MPMVIYLVTHTHQNLGLKQEGGCKLEDSLSELQSKTQSQPSVSPEIGGGRPMMHPRRMQTLPRKAGTCL